MSTVYNKKVTLTISESAYNKLTKTAENDRRSINQMASIVVEDYFTSISIEDNSVKLKEDGDD